MLNFFSASAALIVLLQRTGGDPVPEPSTVLLLGIGLAGLAGVGARRKWKKKTVDKS